MKYFLCEYLPLLLIGFAIVILGHFSESKNESDIRVLREKVAVMQAELSAQDDRITEDHTPNFPAKGCPVCEAVAKTEYWAPYPRIDAK